MEKLNFGKGIKEYEVNGEAVLRFNPSDPAVYHRFCEIEGKLSEIEKNYAQKVSIIADDADERGYATQGGSVLNALRELDIQMKSELTYLFGQENNNNFEKIFGGVNLLAPTETGERVIVNFFNAIRPIMEDGIKKYTQDMVDEAKQNREQRRAAQ